jgi:hypothetical protein
MPETTAVRHKRGGLYFEDFQDGKLVAECRRQAFMRMRPT